MDKTSFSGRMRTLLGARGWIENPQDLEPHRRDWLQRPGAMPFGLARPASTREVADIVRLCREADMPITPQGGNTSLVKGGILAEEAEGIILSLSRMKSVLEIDAVGLTACVEAGLVLSALHETLSEKDLMFPLHLGSEGSAQIGGLISTNAGGSHALRYGMMQDLVLGLEVVLPDGTVWNGLRTLLKDNAGYQLRRLFCGSEGTLGIVTRAALRLEPLPTTRATALLAAPDLPSAVMFGARFRQKMGGLVTALEFFTETGLEMALRHVPGLARPLEGKAPIYILAELACVVDLPLGQALEKVLEDCFENKLISDGSIAANEAQRGMFWRLREEMPEGQRLEGPQLKHDVAVPISRLAEFIASSQRALERLAPDVRVNAFGHLGDGNVHFNLSPGAGEDDFGGREDELAELVYDAAVKMGGTFAAEHGLGRTKVTLADRLRAAPERHLMRQIKAAIDPTGILNPGVII